MLRSAGWRFFIVGLLTLFMFIPLFFVGNIISDRMGYARDAAREVGDIWGGPQSLSGPFLVVPVQGPLKTMIQETVPGADGQAKSVTREVITQGAHDDLVIMPEVLNVSIDAQSQERKRGIFRVPVYSAEVQITADFAVPEVTAVLDEGEVPQWDRAQLVLKLTQNRALRGTAELLWRGQPAQIEPQQTSGGIAAQVGDPRQGGGTASMTLGVNGAEQLMLMPLGRDTQVSISSNWPDPSFYGSFLPDSSEISDSGFSAQWKIPHLARNIPQIGRDLQAPTPRDAYAKQSDSFGVKFFTPNGFYQKAYRASYYSILFIALTFLSVLLIENRSGKPAHPVQYLLIGLAQAVFVLLMVAYAEQIGFALAYLGASVATIGLITFYGFIGLGLGRRSLALGVSLVVLYAVLYLVLQSTDYALLAGATLAFLALLVTMVLTRNEDWYGPVKPSQPKPSSDQ